MQLQQVREQLNSRSSSDFSVDFKVKQFNFWEFWSDL
jgi:hypothetical protein